MFRNEEIDKLKLQIQKIERTIESSHNSSDKPQHVFWIYSLSGPNFKWHKAKKKELHYY